MDMVSLLQIGSALFLNAGFCWLVGTWFARWWLTLAGIRPAYESALRKTDLLAAGLAAFSGASGLLAATAIMGGVGLREACGMFWMLITSTGYGHSGSVTVIALLGLFALRLYECTGWASSCGGMLLLVLFAVLRASMGHAGEGGIWTVALAAEVIHLSAVGLWTGLALVSGWLVLHASFIGNIRSQATDRYLGLMSRAALLAVVGIAATGTYSAWHRVGAPAQLLGTGYGITLLVKVALVLVAIALGGYNKFFGLPAASRSVAGLRLVRLLLRIETLVLLGAVLAACALISQQPPASM